MPATTQTQCIGVGIDTGRYGHHASFLRPDRNEAAKPLTFAESAEGYAQLAAVIRNLQQKDSDCSVHVHIDAAGQYATNLELFVRGLAGVTTSVGEPKRNKDYHAAISPKQKSDTTESYAMARFVVAEHPPSSPARSAEILVLQEITRRLKAKVADSTRAVNRLHNLMARVFPELAKLVPDFAAGWVLALLQKYPTAQRIARAQLSSLKKIRYAPKRKVEAVQRAASKSVGGLEGESVEQLVQLAVKELSELLQQRRELEKLVEQAYARLPASGHQQLITIPGIGLATAAVLVSKVVSIDRFDTAEKLVGYFGCCPRRYQSGVEKNGEPKPNKATRMSKQGCDLARAYLYSAAKTAIRQNPAVRALYQRLRARGARGDVALGHCMRKLLHLVFAVWKTNRPFNPQHYPWQQPPSAAASETAAPDEKEKAAGRKRDIVSDSSAVTAAPASLESSADEVKSSAPAAPAPAATPAGNPPSESASEAKWIDYQALRSHISLQQILEHLHILPTLRSAGHELRGPCPIHQAEGHGARHRSFAANLHKNVFCCFHPECSAKGNQLDLWALLHHQTIYQAAQHLAQTFNLSPTLTEKRSP